MVMKKCKICGKNFEVNSRGRPREYCSDECIKIKEREHQKKYRESEHGKLKRKEYRQSEKGKHKNREYQKKYRKTEKGKKVNKKSFKKYIQKKIFELNEIYDGDLNLILENIPSVWMEREAKMQVLFNESYYDGIIAKIESTPICEVTGEKEDLVIHHLNSFNTHPELSNDVANMVRISKPIHSEFHNIYGYGNNTVEQWEEFINILKDMNSKI